MMILAWSAVVDAQQAQPKAQEADTMMRLEACLGCHEKQYAAIESTAHWFKGDPRTPAALLECSTCHGRLEEHVLGGGDIHAEGLQTYRTAGMSTPAEKNAVCTGCHKETALVHWYGSSHDSEDLGCVSCHRVHQPDKVRHRSTQSEVCYGCHAATRVQNNKPYGHPMREQKMTCSDCHAAHGGPGDAELKTFSVNETCYDCHAEKRGPFLWEHAPASENCILCHSAHGSMHKDMLTRRQPHLCQSCHEPTAIANNPLGPHARHARLALSYRLPGGVDQGPDPAPGSRGISRFVLGEACTNCHSHVHGTNHPAGAKLTR